MTPASQKTAPLPLWRLISGIAVLAALALLLGIGAMAYANNFVLGRYVKSVAADKSIAGLPDAEIAQRIMNRAAGLGLPIHRYDVEIRHENGVRIRLAKYSMKTALFRMDLRMPGVEAP